MKTKPEGAPELTYTLDNVSREIESEKEEFLSIKNKWRNIQKRFKRKWSKLKERKGGQTNN